MAFQSNVLTRQIQIELARKPKIPRPPNAFMLYANENRKKMARGFPLDSNKEISKRLGLGWKDLDQEKKAAYFALAKKVDAEHKKKYPNYVYNPKEARIRKAMRDAGRDRTMAVAADAAGHGAPPSARAARGSGRRSQPLSSWLLQQPAATPPLADAAEEHFMMNPTHTMRGMVSSHGGPGGSPMFPIVGGDGQFMGPAMHSYNKHMHLLPHETENSYLQSNPMAQLQHQTDLWNQYHQSSSPMRTNQTEQFMLPSSQMPTYHHHHSHQQQQQQQQHHHHPPPPQQQQQPRQTPNEKIKDVFPLSEAPPSPHPNENLPPNTGESVGLLESQVHSSSSSYLDQVYQENVVIHNPFDKTENVKIKKSSPPSAPAKLQKSLPDFNEAFGSTERGRFQSPPEPRLPPKQGYLDYFFTSTDVKFEDYHI